MLLLLVVLPKVLNLPVFNQYKSGGFTNALDHSNIPGPLNYLKVLFIGALQEVFLKF